MTDWLNPKSAFLAALLLAALLLAPACGTEATPAPVPALDAEAIAARMRALEGEPLLVNFWARWCKPCIEELPLLDSAQVMLQEDGGRVVGICVDLADGSTQLDKARELVPRFLARRDIGFESWLYDSADTRPLWDVFELPRPREAPGTIPITLAVDAAGGVRDFHEGLLTHADLERLRAAARGLR